MNKKLISILLAICLIVGLLPAVAIPHALAEVTTATVTLFGTEVTVNLLDAEIPDAHYWVNGANGGAPQAVTVADEEEDSWNYSFKIIDGIPTVTLRGAVYAHEATFLTANFDGELKVAYEGSNEIDVQYKKSGGYEFVNFMSSTNKEGSAELHIEGADGASLSVTGGSKGKSIITLKKKPHLYITGGTFSIEADNIGTGNTTIGYATVYLSGGYGNVYINGANVTVKNTAADQIGILAKGLVINGSNLEVDATSQALKLTNAPVLDTDDGKCDMFIAKDGAAVTEYTATAYFKAVCADAPAPATTTPTTSSTSVPTTSAPTTSAPTTSAPTTSAPSTSPTASTGKPGEYKLSIHGVEYELTNCDIPVYLKNTKKTGYYKVSATDPTTGADVTEAKAIEYDTVSTDGADASNYNAKLVWNTGDIGATLYLKDFVLDEYKEDAGWRYTAATLNNEASYAAIHTGSAAPLKIVIESGNCVMQVYEGIHYQNDLTIESVGDASLTMYTNWTGILPASAGSGFVHNYILSGNDLTLNANLNITQTTLRHTEYGRIIFVNGGDLTINGGHIVTNSTISGNIKGVAVLSSGNLYMNDGYIYSESYNKANNTEGAIQVAGNAYIAGGTVDMVAANQSGLVAQNIYITGGYVKTRVSLASLLVREESGVISFTGGVLDLFGAKEPFRYNPTTTSQAAKELVLKEGGTLQGWVGPNIYALEEYAGTYKAYNKLAYEPVEKNVMPTPVPGGDIPLKTTVTIGGDGSSNINLELKKYDDDVFYTVNKAVESVDTEGNTYTRWIQTTDGADENNWNAKFVWHSTDSAPTLYLNGFQFDYWNNDTSKFDATPEKTTAANNTAIETGSGTPMIIKLVGKDSLIESRFGILYSNDLTILSEGNVKMTMDNESSCVSSGKVTGYTLTVNANLDLSIRSVYIASSTNYSGGCLMNLGDIIIDGGTIVCDNKLTQNKDVNGIVARGDDGDLIINGGNITAVSANGRGHRNGALQANGMLIINDGVINASARTAIGMNGMLGVEINGGEITVNAPWYGITSGYAYRDEDNKLQHVLEPIKINGGTMTIISEKAFFSGTVVTIGEGVMAYAGAGKKNAEVYDGYDNKLITKPWFFSTDDESKFLVIEDEEEDDGDIIITMPTAPTTGDGTVAPTDSTDITGSTSATTRPNGSEDSSIEDEIPEEEEEEWYHSNIYVDYTEGDMDYIPDALYDVGLDTVDAIWDTMLQNLWWVDEYINRVSFFDAVPWFYDGEQWIFADETHLPEDGFVTVVLPYPEGTDINTEFTAVHMFTTDYFGMTPGDVELVYNENTEEGIYLELTGLSPIMLGWTDWDAEEEPPLTGDTDVAIFFTMMMVSVLGMATTVIYSKKRRAR